MALFYRNLGMVLLKVVAAYRPPPLSLRCFANRARSSLSLINLIAVLSYSCPLKLLPPSGPSGRFVSVLSHLFCFPIAGWRVDVRVKDASKAREGARFGNDIAAQVSIENAKIFTFGFIWARKGGMGNCVLQDVGGVDYKVLDVKLQ
jgi:hypothetical protein